jgi:hypothetical protein
MSTDNKTTQIGYIVINEHQGAALSLLRKPNNCWKNLPKGGLLLICNREVSCFPSRRAARTAITRTKDYFKLYDDRQEEYTIRRLTAE